MGQGGSQGLDQGGSDAGGATRDALRCVRRKRGEVGQPKQEEPSLPLAPVVPLQALEELIHGPLVRLIPQTLERSAELHLADAAVAI